MGTGFAHGFERREVKIRATWHEGVYVVGVGTVGAEQVMRLSLRAAAIH